MCLEVIEPGLLTSVQDEGRFGHQRIGMSPAGAMDAHALHLANILVDNPRGEAALELTLLGGKFRFTRDNVFALTGADMGATLGGQPAAAGRALSARAGDVLALGPARSGCRAYLAVAGGFDLPALYGSKSTLLRDHMGGFQGRKLAAGDRLPFAAPRAGVRNQPIRQLPPQTPYPAEALVRVVPGPQEERFTRRGLETFYNSAFTVSPKCDRMGYRLSGEKIEHVSDANIISDGIALGAVQVPGSGEPIIMMAEHQGSGGYTKIANVISVDVSRVAQCAPGARIRFQAVSVEEAQALYLARLEGYARLEEMFNRAQLGMYRLVVNGRAFSVGVADVQEQ